MFYLVIESHGKKDCIMENVADVFKNDFNAQCLNSHPFLGKALMVRQITIQCSDNAGQFKEAWVYFKP